MRETFPMRQVLLAALLLSGLSSAAHASARAEPSPAPPAPESAATPASPRLLGPTPSRGQLLYENHCLACHESSVHIRARRTARAMPDVRASVARWAMHLKLDWKQEEIDDVAAYLNGRFYQFAPR